MFACLLHICTLHPDCVLLTQKLDDTYIQCVYLVCVVESLTLTSTATRGTKPCSQLPLSCMLLVGSKLSWCCGVQLPSLL